MLRPAAVRFFRSTGVWPVSGKREGRTLTTAYYRSGACCRKELTVRQAPAIDRDKLVFTCHRRRDVAGVEERGASPQSIANLGAHRSSLTVRQPHAEEPNP